MINKYLTCESCVYYENRHYGYNEKSCYWGLIGNFPCCHYIEDAKHYDEVIERSLFFNSEIKEFDFNSCIEAIIKNAEKHEYETYLKLKEKFGD